MSSGIMAAAAQPNDTEHRIAIMKAGDVCRILERERESHSGLQLRLELGHNCRLHKHRLAHMIPLCQDARQGPLACCSHQIGPVRLHPKKQDHAVVCRCAQLLGVLRERADDSAVVQSGHLVHATGKEQPAEQR